MQEPFVKEEQLIAVVEKFHKNRTSFQPIKELLSQEQLCYLVFKGAYSILAHKKSQDKRNSRLKLADEVLKIAEKDPELAVKLGLGTRS